MVSVTSTSRYHLRYQSRSSMYIRGLIPQNFAEVAKRQFLLGILKEILQIKTISSWNLCQIVLHLGGRPCGNMEISRCKLYSTLISKMTTMAAILNFFIKVLLFSNHMPDLTEICEWQWGNKEMSRSMIFPTMWYVRPAKAQISLWSELLIVAWILYDC